MGRRSNVNPNGFNRRVQNLIAEILTKDTTLNSEMYFRESTAEEKRTCGASAYLDSMPFCWLVWSQIHYWIPVCNAELYFDGVTIRFGIRMRNDFCSFPKPVLIIRCLFNAHVAQDKMVEKMRTLAPNVIQILSIGSAIYHSILENRLHIRSSLQDFRGIVLTNLPEIVREVYRDENMAINPTAEMYNLSHLLLRAQYKSNYQFESKDLLAGNYRGVQFQYLIGSYMESATHELYGDGTFRVSTEAEDLLCGSDFFVNSVPIDVTLRYNIKSGIVVSENMPVINGIRIMRSIRVRNEESTFPQPVLVLRFQAKSAHIKMSVDSIIDALSNSWKEILATSCAWYLQQSQTLHHEEGVDINDKNNSEQT